MRARKYSAAKFRASKVSSWKSAVWDDPPDCRGADTRKSIRDKEMWPSEFSEHRARACARSGNVQSPSRTPRQVQSIQTYAQDNAVGWASNGQTLRCRSIGACGSRVDQGDACGDCIVLVPRKNNLPKRRATMRTCGRRQQWSLGADEQQRRNCLLTGFSSKSVIQTVMQTRYLGRQRCRARASRLEAR